MNRPVIPAGTHPIEQGGYILPTMEVKRLMESLTKIVINRLPGMIVYGRPRIGKSISIEFALNYLPMQLGTLFPILRTKCSSYRVPTEEKFFGDMLSDLKFPFPAKRNPSAMRQQIVNLMLEQGERSRMRRIMLVIDEAQRLTEIHYNWLMDICSNITFAGGHRLSIGGYLKPKTRRINRNCWRFATISSPVIRSFCRES
ncbi:AAA family ATPase [Paenibacillus tyrfis]|uniref:AAA+ ATPase domain-containing protein n=1 Tax=Paenibacillus tyrfis TaxID=1501230 RepID=A0A081NVP2_9BACL|nr:TniB family NTP-binding protein [Paenibacillus tyrfis]KEQ22515.1 hypothetical protein ET33_22770 [Paenibacillus tyrfis]